MDERESRRQKLIQIHALGHDPWGKRFDGRIPIGSIRRMDHASQPPVRAAGRITGLRTAGKVIFMDIWEWTGSIQLLVAKNRSGDDAWELSRLLDLGDIIGADGHYNLTRTGEPTVFVDRIHMMSKCLEVPPDKRHGLRDIEKRYRMRYLDLIYGKRD